METRTTIPRTLKEMAVMKPDKRFISLWKKYLSENKELTYKKNAEYKLFINAIAKYNYTQKGIEDIYVAHNQAIGFFTE